uniref:Uncharacterized protein n=1 Tax=Oryza sativa subsp. japonica TaxID=39947 RepID=Q6ESL4_ORYSJ|nr:hypothetical protein [Oryza sativa Japonica Group]
MDSGRHVVHGGVVVAIWATVALRPAIKRFDQHWQTRYTYVYISPSSCTARRLRGRSSRPNSLNSRAATRRASTLAALSVFAQAGRRVGKRSAGLQRNSANFYAIETAAFLRARGPCNRRFPFFHVTAAAASPIVGLRHPPPRLRPLQPPPLHHLSLVANTLLSRLAPRSASPDDEKSEREEEGEEGRERG